MYVCTTVKYYDELIRSVQKGHYIRKKNQFLKIKQVKAFNAMSAVRTLYAHVLRAVSTLQQLLARCIRASWTL